MTSEGILDLRAYQRALRDFGFATTNEAEKIGNMVKADSRWPLLVAKRRDDAEEAAKIITDSAEKEVLTAILKNLKGQ
jgi:hypothetical protein